MRIDRCVCYEKTFVQLQRVAERTRARSLAELQQHVVFGKRCQMCHPYVRAMLRSGQTVFDQLLEE